MVVDVVYLLAVPVVDNQPVVVGDPKSLNHQFDRPIQEVQDLGRGLLEVAVFYLRKKEQVDRVLGPVISDDNDLVVLQKYPGRYFAADYAAKNAGHGAEYRLGRSECNIDLRLTAPLANVEGMY